jgi:hypothetical protein
MNLEQFLQVLDEEINEYLNIPDIEKLEELLILLRSAFKEARKNHSKELSELLRSTGVLLFMQDAKEKSIKLMKDYSSFELDESTGNLLLYKQNKVEKRPLVSVRVILNALIGEKQDVVYYLLLGMFSIPEYYEMAQLKIAYDLKG